jgi:Tat protein translocase TatB subunit
MLGLGWGEILLMGGVALVVVGPERLPRLMRDLGRYYGQLRRAADELRRSFVLEADRQDAEERYAKLQERRKAAAEARRAAMAGQSPEADAAADGTEPPPPTDDDDDDPNALDPDAPHPVQVPRRTPEELAAAVRADDEEAAP